MAHVKFPFAGGAYRARSPVATAQTCINLYAEVLEEGRSKAVLYGTPGITEFSDVGGLGPLRGWTTLNDQLHAVIGNSLYLIQSNGTAGSLGAIGGSGPVAIASNQTQIFISNGSQGYIYTVSGGLVSISDADFFPTYTTDYVDGYFLAFDTSGQQWTVSALDDGLGWNGVDYASAESEPDKIVAGTGFRGEVWIFGTTTTEIWYNAANPTGNPFSPNKGATIQRGCLAKYSVDKNSSALFWLADDKSVYSAAGGSLQKISTPAIDYEIAQESSPEDAIGFTYTQEGHSFYVLTFPSGKTWVFDTTTGLWHQRQSYGLDRWRAQFAINAYGKVLVGDYSLGKIGELDLDTFTEYGELMRWERTCQPITDSSNGIFLDRVELVMESGVGSATNPIVYLQPSTDGGRTFGFPQEANYGAVGQYRWRTFWNQLGWAENFTLRFWGTDSFRRAIVDASIDLEQGAP
jgi:hypothetical protein